MRSGLTLKHKYLFGDSKGLPIVFGKRELKFDHTPNVTLILAITFQFFCRANNVIGILVLQIFPL